MFFGVGEKLERKKKQRKKGSTFLSLLSQTQKLKNSKKTRNFPTHNSGDRTHHLLLELHSTGNICLTDADYRVLTLLRSHRLANAEAAAGTPEAAPAMASSSSRSSGVVVAASRNCFFRAANLVQRGPTSSARGATRLSSSSSTWPARSTTNSSTTRPMP